MSFLQPFDSSLPGHANPPALEGDRGGIRRPDGTPGELDARRNRLAHGLRLAGSGFAPHSAEVQKHHLPAWKPS